MAFTRLADQKDAAEVTVLSNRSAVKSLERSVHADNRRDAPQDMVETSSWPARPPLLAAWALVAILCSCGISKGDKQMVVVPLPHETLEFLQSGNFGELDERFSAVQQAYKSGAATDENLETAFQVFYNSSTELESKYDLWVSLYPKSYVAHLARGIFYESVGDALRGSGSSKNMQPFRDAGIAFEKARRDFEVSITLDPKPLLSYAHEITIPRGNPNEKRRLLDQSILIAPSNYIVRFRYMTALGTDWHRNQQLMKSFLEECQKAKLSEAHLKALESVIADYQERIKPFAKLEKVQPTNLNPASACEGGGGKYLGDMKCQLSDGLIVPILGGADAVRARASSIPVTPGSPQAWALATTAITFEYNGSSHDTLAGAVVTPIAMERGKNLLSQWWGINNRDDLLKTLRWLQFEGHRSEFSQLGSQMSALDDAQFLRAKVELRLDAEQLNRLDVVRHYYVALGSKGILAWDIVRYISLCRWGYQAGYLEETEAWDHIMPAALRLQQTFVSWRDLENDFLIGREFWSLQQARETGPSFRDIYDRFINEDDSPWNKNDWNRSLLVLVPLPIVDDPPEKQALH